MRKAQELLGETQMVGTPNCLQSELQLHCNKSVGLVLSQNFKPSLLFVLPLEWNSIILEQRSDTSVTLVYVQS